MKTCTNCKKQVRIHLLGSFCSRECSRSYAAKYREANRGRINENSRKYGRKPEVRRVDYHWWAHTYVQKYLKDVSDPPTCKRCEGSVPVRHYGARWSSYCSQRCKSGSEAGDTAKCEHCLNAYKKKRRDQKYCSQRCRSKAGHNRLAFDGWRPSRVSECQWCGFGFLGSGMFCGGECERHAMAACVSVRWLVRLARPPRKARTLHVSCVDCGATFPEPKVSAYCDRTCQKRAYRKTDTYKKGKARWRVGWKRRNPEKHRERKKARRDAIRGSGNHNKPTTTHRTTMVNPLTRQVCHYCGKDCTGDFHWDHFVPISKGGPEAPWNLVVSCPTCNLSKSDKLPESIFCDELGLVT